MTHPQRGEWPYIESVIVKRLEIAKARYEDSKRMFLEAVAVRSDVGLQHADGRTGLTQASKAFSYTLREYRDALVAFNEFILDGKVPEDLQPR
jgi:hypothetical protein